MTRFRHMKTHVDFLFLLVIFGVFFVCTLFIATFGAKIYRNTVTKMEENNTGRTVSSYFSEKIKKNDTENSVYVCSLHQLSVLCLSNRTQNGDYTTYLYFWDGFLKELTLRSDAPFSPEDGTDILPLDAFSVTQNGSLFSFQTTDSDGNRSNFQIGTMCPMKEGGDFLE